MTPTEIHKWASSLITDALVHAACGGSFQEYLITMIQDKFLDADAENRMYNWTALQAQFDKQKDELYAKAYKEGQKSASDTSAYDNGYKVGYKDASDIAESNRRWDSFKPGDMK